MTIYDELVARGLIAQVTDEEEIKDLINNGKATFYKHAHINPFLQQLLVFLHTGRLLKKEKDQHLCRPLPRCSILFLRFIMGFV